MGADKATIEVDGVAMARRVADALLAAGASSVVAIGGDAATLGGAGLDVLADEHPGEGPLGAVVQALVAAPTPVVAVLACDLVRPGPATIAEVVARRTDADADVAVPLAAGRPQWTHAVWHRRVAGVLGEMFAAGERSLVGSTVGLHVAVVDVADPGATRDADHPAELPDGARWPRRP